MSHVAVARAIARWAEQLAEAIARDGEGPDVPHLLVVSLDALRSDMARIVAAELRAARVRRDEAEAAFGRYERLAGRRRLTPEEADRHADADAAAIAASAELELLEREATR